MSRARLWLVAYDIAEPRRLGKVARDLEKLGARQQKSVFECGLSRDDHQALKFRLTNLVQAQDGDKLLMHPLCTQCRRNIRWQGAMPAVEAEPFWIV
jgi:CRISPR-associated protein Cas2